MKSFKKMASILAGLTVGVAIVDQLTKVLVRATIQESTPIKVIPGLLNMVQWHNRGIAFGLFQGKAILLTIFGMAALIGIPILFYWEWKRDPRLENTIWGLGLILGGALGNLIDRVRCGAVTDFIDVYIGSSHWPAFNFADSCICIGTVLVLYCAYKASFTKEDLGSTKMTD